MSIIFVIFLFVSSYLVEDNQDAIKLFILNNFIFTGLFVLYV